MIICSIEKHVYRSHFGSSAFTREITSNILLVIMNRRITCPCCRGRIAVQFQRLELDLTLDVCPICLDTNLPRVNQFCHCTKQLHCETCVIEYYRDFYKDVSDDDVARLIVDDIPESPLYPDPEPEEDDTWEDVNNQDLTSTYVMTDYEIDVRHYYRMRNAVDIDDIIASQNVTAYSAESLSHMTTYFVHFWFLS